uniref:Uncharacterized protein n=1 Tax=Tanacetum cinerariifolium TaxID=118510 RepID=A0A6L2L4D2_TANCI|nr:hypothetical protein [Tanacetum cinerariifolium]
MLELRKPQQQLQAKLKTSKMLELRKPQQQLQIGSNSRSVPADSSRSVPAAVARSVPAVVARSVPAAVARSVPAAVARSVPAAVARSVPTAVARSVPALNFRSLFEEIHMIWVYLEKKQTRLQTLHQRPLKNSLQCLEMAALLLATASNLSSDGVRKTMTASERSRLKETLEDSAERWR